MSVAADQTRTRVPSQYRVVVSRWTYRLGALVPRHRIPKGIVGHRPAAHPTTLKQRLTTALERDSGVVRAPVIVGNSRQRFSYGIHCVSVPLGQLEAARTLGLSERQVLTLVRGPQAFRLALAPMTNDFVALLKDSSLVSVLTVMELTKQTQVFATNLGSWMIPGSLCAAMYLMMSLPLAGAARRLERRWKAPTR